MHAAAICQRILCFISLLAFQGYQIWRIACFIWLTPKAEIDNSVQGEENGSDIDNVFLVLLVPKFWLLSQHGTVVLLLYCTSLSRSRLHPRPCLRQLLSLPRAGRLAMPGALWDGSPRLGGPWHA